MTQEYSRLKSEQQAIAIPPRRKCHHVREVFWGRALKETSGARKGEKRDQNRNGRKMCLGRGNMQRKYLHHRCIDDTFRGGGGGGGVGFTMCA